MSVTLNRFATIELLSEHLTANYHQYVASPQSGGNESISAFSAWLDGREDAKQENRNIIFLPTDPTTFLVFPTIRQEVEIFRSPADAVYAQWTPSQIAKDFKLSDSNLDQPIHTLSGGERTKAALLKISLLLPKSNEICISCPAQWLDGESYYLLNRLTHRAVAMKVKLTLHVLEGDPWPSQPIEHNLQKKKPEARPTISFRQSYFTVNLDEAEDPNSPVQLHYDISAIGHTRITSPVLIAGNNGAGKSVFAKCIAGMLVSRDELTPLSSMGAGFGRIILQDCLSHYFRSKILGHPSRVFDFDSDAMKRTINLFRDLCEKARKILCKGDPQDAYLVGSDLEPSTMLQAKIMLVAERLAYYPTVLILDEPSWGLSLIQCHAFLEVTITQCHEKGVPVMIIAHDIRPIPFSIGGTILLKRNDQKVTAEFNESTD